MRRRKSDGSATGVAHDAVTDAAGASDLVAHAEVAHDDTEADRTLTSGTASKDAADSDEADTSDSCHLGRILGRVR